MPPPPRLGVEMVMETDTMRLKEIVQMTMLRFILVHLKFGTTVLMRTAMDSRTLTKMVMDRSQPTSVEQTATT